MGENELSGIPLKAQTSTLAVNSFYVRDWIEMTIYA